MFSRESPNSNDPLRETNGEIRTNEHQELTSFFGQLGALKTSSVQDTPHNVTEATARHQYTSWEKTGLAIPHRRSDIRDWLQTVGLRRDEDYLLDPSVGSIFLGLGWDEGADVDASAAMFDEQMNVMDTVWFKKLTSSCGSIVHSGDNRTGEGSGDDEVIRVDMDSLPVHIHYILFTVSVYSFDLSFRDLQGAYVRMMHGKVKHEMCRFSLTEMHGHSMLMGLMIRKGGYWNFKALGYPAEERTLNRLLKNPRNLTCLSKNPSVAPLMRRIVVTVGSGTDLSPKDPAGIFRRHASSDPYYIINFKNKTYTSEHKKRTLNPEWKEHAFDLGAVVETERKALKISVFDYDCISSDDFMGIAWIPSSALYNLGQGTHNLSVELEPSKDIRFRHEDVSGNINLRVNVTELGRTDTLSRILV